MANAEAPKADAAAKGEEAAAAPPPAVGEQLRAIVGLIELAVRHKETRVAFSKVLRQTQAARRRMTAADVQAFVRSTLPEGSASRDALLEHLQEVRAARSPRDRRLRDRLPPAAPPSPPLTRRRPPSLPAQADGMDTDAAGADAGAAAAAPPPGEPLPEVEAYAHLLTVMALVDAKRWPAARAAAEAAADRLAAFNRRTLDALSARIHFYLAWAAERCGAAPAIRSRLLAALRTAALRHDDVGQETLLNLLLRDLLAARLYSQAEALRAQAASDAPPRAPAQHARLLFHLGRIRAVQLEYSDARDALAHALRRAPAAGAGAAGFRAAATKWLVVVRLLLGEVPPRAELAAPDLARALGPYLALARAVRRGDLARFAAVAAEHDAAFEADGTRRLVARLRASVIRAGLRRLAAAYSKIALADVAARLGLPSADDAAPVVAKAIRDGGVAARLDRDEGVMLVPARGDAYAGPEPAAAFHARVAFCMEVHNEALRAMRFGASAAKREWDDANALRERQEQELQAALEEDEFDM